MIGGKVLLDHFQADDAIIKGNSRPKRPTC